MELKKGMIFVRSRDGQPEHLFYTKETILKEQRPFLAQNIAEMPFETTRLYINEAVEPFQHGMRSGLGILVEFRPASDADIKLFLGNWDSKVGPSIKEWVANMEKACPDLFSKEKERIYKIAAQYM